VQGWAQQVGLVVLPPPLLPARASPACIEQKGRQRCMQRLMLWCPKDAAKGCYIQATVVLWPPRIMVCP